MEKRKDKSALFKTDANDNSEKRCRSAAFRGSLQSVVRTDPKLTSMDWRVPAVARKKHSVVERVYFHINS
nr:MAG: hypothetical protein AM324_03720 [Candidatus Thorarchaeota archaeon SMTZ1-83]